jgi:hypothetical protein
MPRFSINSARQRSTRGWRPWTEGCWRQPAREGSSCEFVRRDVVPNVARLGGLFQQVSNQAPEVLSGIIQSLSTQWGLFQHYWILLKLLLTTLATIVSLLHMQPTNHLAGVAGQTALSSADLRGLRINSSPTRVPPCWCCSWPRHLRCTSPGELLRTVATSMLRTPVCPPFSEWTRRVETA